MAENPEQEEWRLIHQISAQEIDFFKGQQWKISNYGLLLYAAIVGIATLLRCSPTEAERWALSALVWIIGACGVYVVWNLHKAIEAQRTRLNVAFDHFSENVRKTLSALNLESRVHADVSVLLTIVLVMGAVITSWLLVCRLQAR